MSENLNLYLALALARILGIWLGIRNYLVSEMEFEGDLSIDLRLVLRLVFC